MDLTARAPSARAVPVAGPVSPQGDATFHVPYGFADAGELPRERSERGEGGIDARRRPPSVGARPGRLGQFLAARLSRVASPRLRERGRRNPEPVRIERSLPPRLSLESGG